MPMAQPPAETGVMAAGVHRTQRDAENGAAMKEEEGTNPHRIHGYNDLLLFTPSAGVVELADARDSKSRGAYTP